MKVGKIEQLTINDLKIPNGIMNDHLGTREEIPALIAELLEFTEKTNQLIKKSIFLLERLG